MVEPTLYRPACPLLHRLGTVAKLGTQGAHPHLAHLLVPVQQVHAHIHNILCPLLSSHAQLAQGILNPLALHIRARLPLHHGSLLDGKYTLDGVQIPLIFHLLADIPNHLTHFNQVNWLVDKEIHSGQVGLGHHLFAADLGDHNKFCQTTPLLQLADYLYPVLAGHQQVHQHQVRCQCQDLIQVQSASAVSAHGPQVVALYNIL